MKNSLIEFIKSNKEIKELTEILENDIIEEVDKQLKREEYEEMEEDEWMEYHLFENELEVLKNLDELHKNRLDEKNKKIKKAAILYH